MKRLIATTAITGVLLVLSSFGFAQDAGAFGNRLGLEETYRFARGEEVVSTTAVRA